MLSNTSISLLRQSLTVFRWKWYLIWYNVIKYFIPHKTHTSTCNLFPNIPLINSSNSVYLLALLDIFFIHLCFISFLHQTFIFSFYCFSCAIIELHIRLISDFTLLYYTTQMNEMKTYCLDYFILVFWSILVQYYVTYDGKTEEKKTYKKDNILHFLFNCNISRTHTFCYLFRLFITAANDIILPYNKQITNSLLISYLFDMIYVTLLLLFCAKLDNEQYIKHV